MSLPEVDTPGALLVALVYEHLLSDEIDLNGLGEAKEDRLGSLHTLATLPAHPESDPINALVAVKGTPLQDQKGWTSMPMSIGRVRVSDNFMGSEESEQHRLAVPAVKPIEIWEMIRMIATARIVMPNQWLGCQLAEYVSLCLSKHYVFSLVQTLSSPVRSC